jgi:phospholipid/cholesterol/gamma-HCH transport system substrate-binding protein
MESKVNYAAVGLFVIGLGLALILSVLWLAAGGEWQRHTSRYESVSTESVAGLNVNAPVKLRGVDVGKVKSIAINPTNDEEVRIVYEIEEGTPIKTDTVATLTSQGLTGIAYVELSGGSANAPALTAKEGELPRIAMRPSLTARLESVLSRVLASVDKTSENINGVFSDENKAALTRTLNDLSTISHAIAARKDTIDKLIADAGTTMHNTSGASARISSTLDKVSAGADSVNAAADRIGALGVHADTTVKDVGADVHRFTTEALPQLENMMIELSALSASLKRLSDQTADNPSSLIRGTPPVRKGPGE